MNYQEKLEFAEKGVALISQGKSFDYCENYLINEGLNKYDIIKVIRSIKNIISEKYGSELYKLLQFGELQNINTNFQNLSQDVFAYLKEKEIENIVQDTKFQIKELIHKNVDPEEILTIVKTEFLSTNEITEYIENYASKNKYLKPERRVFNFIKGAFLIIAGAWRFSVTGNIFINLLWFVGGIYLITLSRKK